MIKLITIIGARPQIIKAAAISRAIREHFSSEIIEVIVHTGQHYDTNMSEIFIQELNIPQPDYNLNVGSESHGKQTALMIEGIEKILLKEQPDFIVLYGDTNSTLAGAIAAVKIHIPIVHIEAGLRSHNKNMPEEINRIVCDHSSTLLFSPTITGVNNLEKEGFDRNSVPPYSASTPGVFHCGDIMLDNSKYFSLVASQRSDILEKNELKPDNYILATIHRDNNTDDPHRLNAIFKALQDISTQNNLKIIVPLHPRTAKIFDKKLDEELFRSIKSNHNFIFLKPVSFIDMIQLEKNARIILTDSGGVQKEAFFYKKPCLIMRSETEWKEIIDSGCGVITDADYDEILQGFNTYNSSKDLDFPEVFGDGAAAEFICKTLLSNC